MLISSTFQFAKRCASSIALLITVFIASNAQAIPIVWELQDVAFSDSTAAVGSFVFDADTSEVSEVNIMTSPGQLFLCTEPTCQDGFDLGPMAPGTQHSAGIVGQSADGSSFVFIDLAALDDETLVDDFLLFLALEESLTNAGGMVSLVPDFVGIEFICLDVDCANFDPQVNPSRGIAGGTLTGVAVEEPTTLLLLVLGLVGLVWARRRSQA